MTLNCVPKILSSATVQHRKPQQQKHFNGIRQRLHRKIINIIIAVMMVLLGYCIEGKWNTNESDKVNSLPPKNEETFNYWLENVSR